MSRQSSLQSERGAIIIHVAIALIALLAFTSFVIDYGVMWVSRRQAQNVVDSAALAGALELLFNSSTPSAAILAAQHFAANNPIWGEGNSAANVDVTLSGPGVNIPPCGTNPGCVKANVFRNTLDTNGVIRGNAIPTYFARLVGLNDQGVKATATAQTASGNSINCLLPFAVIDRWADNYDDKIITTYFPNDGLSGTAGWTANDDYQPANGDVYIPPYNGNTNHTGWKVTQDYGRQLVLKDGSVGNYSTGWANLVYFPGSTGANDVKDDIVTCNGLGVGIATASNPCTASDEAHGCLDIKGGVTAGPIKSGINTVVGYDSTAAWNPTAPGPDGLTGAVVGGQGMATPRIRGIAIIDIEHYDNSGCSGGTCIAKVANIIGFFIEGMCDDVIAKGQLDPGLGCDDPTKDIVGRIVTVPASSITGVGTVESSASFLKIVRLVR